MRTIKHLKNEFLNDAQSKIEKCSECGYHSMVRIEDAFDAGIEAQALNEANQLNYILEYCSRSIDFTWASMIAGRLLGCDWRDAKSVLKEKGLIK